ncbi:Rpn family recombination-promoting nuclease/putative transposase [Marvinbryantia formatexigens]|uniref:Rpn family recombination-promoting nuclease/putative transposase n=1 Tax=Marvinbryantia formatexigens TaxID=168384 RepID=UPI0009456206|nr:Rpn family recombination-promoting nuclease/putative transposase [Marvinbryantia formatexigens]UWO26223.1 Rpn family recombination-promoting nuclease/putative transposase [Marvinbryantia formatexigens DSM 14469]
MRTDGTGTHGAGTHRRNSAERKRKQKECQRRTALPGFNKKIVAPDGEIIVALQNQTTVDFGMPLRVMTEDALEYDVQRRMCKDEKLHKGEKLAPVITIVFYYGAQIWSGPTDLADMVKIPEEFKWLKKYIRPYAMLLITPENVDAAWFSGGWREVFEILQRRNDEKEMQRYLQKKRSVYEKLPEDTNRLIFALTGHLDYYNALKRKGERAVMCKAFEDHYKSGVEEGKNIGIHQGISQGLGRGIGAMIRENQEEGKTTESIIDKLQKYFSLSREEALGYIRCNQK